MAVGLKAWQGGTELRFAPAPLHWSSRTTGFAATQGQYKPTRRFSQLWPNHFNKPARLRLCSRPPGLIDMLGSAIIFQVGGVAAIYGKVAALQDNEPPCATQNLVLTDRSIAAGRKAVRYVPLALIVAFDRSAVIVRPSLFAIFTAARITLLRAVETAVQIFRSRRPIRSIRDKRPRCKNCQQDRSHSRFSPLRPSRQ